MRASRLVLGTALFVLILAPAALAQELSLSFGAGGFFPAGEAYRRIYGSGLSIAGDIWLKLEGPVGFAAGFGRLSDKGVAVALKGGEEMYPVEFRRTTIPLTVFYQLDAGPVAIRLGAGAGIHQYRETWQTVDFDFKGRKIAPRFVLTFSVAPVERISVFGQASYESVSTGEGSALSINVNVGGFQIAGGLAFRIF